MPPLRATIRGRIQKQPAYKDSDRKILNEKKPYVKLRIEIDGLQKTRAVASEAYRKPADLHDKS